MQPKPEGLLETPRAVWEVLVDSGALRPRDYDREFIDTLRSQLNLTSRVNLGAALEQGNVSMEAFLGALLGVVEPFALMMSELCSFFERHDVSGTGEGLKIRFSFADAPELSFDLRHFREWLRTWQEAKGIVELHAWTYETVWRPNRIVHDAIDGRYDDPPADPAAALWVALNTYPERQEGKTHYVPAPSPPPTGEPRVDRVVEHFMRMVEAVVDSCAPYRNYATLSAAAEGQPWPEKTSDPTPLATWGVVRLRQLDSDYFVGAAVSLVWRWVERLISKGMLDQAAKIAPDLEQFFGSLPTVEGWGKVRLEQLVEFLRLPAWRARHALYQAWMVAEVERALQDYPMQVHQRDGVLQLGPNVPPVATFHSREGDVVLLTEHRSPLAEPVGTGRKSAIQPDYSLVPATNHDSALAVIETKQYRRPSTRNFVAALTDYARGQPRARVFLADYGRMSDTVLQRIPDGLRLRCFPLGDVRPNGVGSPHFEALLREVLPPPPVTAGRAPVAERLQGIVLDISVSMSDAFQDEAILSLLRRLAEASPKVVWIAADTAIRHRGPGPEGLSAILAMAMTGSTDLPAACEPLALEEYAVVTDAEGRGQLLEAGLQPQALGTVSGSHIEWQEETVAGDENA